MKLGKKATALCAVVAGAAIFTTSALADVVIGSGYYSLKDAVKETARVLTSEMDNFTFDMSMNLKADGVEVVNANGTAKVDMANKKTEQTGIVNSLKDGTEETYTYEDAAKSIYKRNENSYTVYEKVPDEQNGTVLVGNPFEEEIAQDAEKVVDALVGNLKDLVQVEENDGKKMYIGNISDAQIPTVANAMLSFMVKYSMINEQTSEEYGMPVLESDIYVKEVSGKAVQNEAGFLENAVVSGALVGKDENGAEHTITGECVFSLRDLHQTVITEPSLEGEEVEYVSNTNNRELGQKYVGIYKINILEEQNDQFIKIGERIFEITSVEGNNFTATYTEQYKEGYTPEVVRNYAINGYYDADRYEFIFDYTDENGVATHGSLYPNAGDLNVNFGIELDENGGYTIQTTTMDFRSNQFIRVMD